MSSAGRSASLRVEGPLALLAASLLAVSIYYLAVYVYQGPYPGLDYDGRWTVISIEDTCSPNTGACPGGAALLQVGDRITQIGNLTYEDYQNQRTSVPFWGYKSGDHVPLVVERDGQTLNVEWPYLGSTTGPLLLRLTGSLLFLPFWIAGTGVLMLLRPRDSRWLLLVLFNYATGLWITIGSFSSWHMAGSAYVLHDMTFLMVPVYLHLHLLVPTELRLPRARRILSVFYALAAAFVGVDLLYPLPAGFFNLILMLAVTGSLAMLFKRLLDREAKSAQLATRLMLVGIALGFGPAILLWIMPTLAGGRTPGWLLTAITTAALPLQPFFYIYSLYKSRLGNLEFRANRVLSFYSFILICGTVFVIIFLVGSRWTDMTVRGVFFALSVSIAFIALAVWLYIPYQRLVDRLAYGTAHNPDTIIRTFADQIPRALGRPALSRLLIREVSPALLIRQSALYLISGNEAVPVYSEGVEAYARTDLAVHLHSLLGLAGRYLVPEPGSDRSFAWVRLVIHIQVGGKTMAAWLLGKRDPDDYYPQPDIELMTTLGNQVGVALETARLFEDVEHRASELETAYRDLQRLDRLKDEFVQNVSHELRTPLTFLRGYLDLLQEQLLGPLTAEQTDAITTMSDRTEGIIRLVNDILSLQQASAEETLREPVNLTALARSCIEAVEVSTRRQASSQRSHTLRLLAGDDVPPVYGDRRRLAQVIDNLLGNAIKFSPNGGTITVELTSGMERFGPNGATPQPAVTLSVCDEGIGIPNSELEQIWQRFYQVDGSSTRRFGGMGLGLAIARGIVEAHGGKIWAESTEGRGSAFHMVLPIIPPTVDQPVDNFFFA